MTPTVALLSHRGGNIGHDFMAAGMNEAVLEAFGRDVKIVHFEQHRPFEVYGPSHWLGVFNRLQHGRHRAIRNFINRERVNEWLWRRLPDMPYRLAVACGGPNVVPGASKVPEMRLLLHHMNGAFVKRGVPFIDAGVGSAFPLESMMHLDDEGDITFYKKAFKLASKVAVREQVAKSVCGDLGIKADLVPCGAMGSGRLFERIAPPQDARHIVVNFQAHGANTDWGQGVDKEWWKATVRSVIDNLSKRHSLRFLAHSKSEASLVSQFAGDFPCDTPANIQSYAAAIAGAKVGFVSRIHAAVALAGIGVPSVAVGTDTRLRTVAELNLPTLPVKEASVEKIVSIVEDLVQKAGIEKERLRTLRETTVRQYASMFREYSK